MANTKKKDIKLIFLFDEIFIVIFKLCKLTIKQAQNIRSRDI